MQDKKEEDISPVEEKGRRFFTGFQPHVNRARIQEKSPTASLASPLEKGPGFRYVGEILMERGSFKL